MSAPFDAAKARRHGQATRDHPATLDPRPRFGHEVAPRCATCGERIRWVAGVGIDGSLRDWLVSQPGDYHRRPHWRHYPEPPRELCDCGHDPDDHDMRAAPPDCQVAGCPCGEEEATE